MRFPRWSKVLFILLLTCAEALSVQVQAPQKPLRQLQTAAEVHSLIPEEAVKAYPVHLRAVVTYYDPYIDSRHGAIFVHDQSGSIFMTVPKLPILPLHAGDLVDVVGVSGLGDYAPVISDGKITVVGKSHVPKDAPRPTMTQLLSGKWDGQWVEVEGVVHEVHFTATNVILDLATIGGPVSATTLLEKGKNYDSLVDSVVRIHANSGPVFNRKRQLAGNHLFFPTLNELKVVQSATADPFSMPAVPITHIGQFTPVFELPRRIHVRGTVTLHWPSGMLCIQQASSGLCMQDAAGDGISVGDQVDVVGFPAISEYKTTLENAVYRPASVDPSPPLARSITAAQAFKGDRDGELVQIEGNVIGQDHAASDLTLIVRSGDFLFLAVLPKDPNGLANRSWTDGSKLRLTGICSVTVDSATTNRNEGEVRPGSVRILLRSFGDVQVLKAPSWWTTQHALVVLAVVLLLVLAAFVWIAVLHRRVEQQTQALRKSEERLRYISEHDALTNLPNRILLDDRLQMALSRARRFQTGLALLMVDVDLFKDINDSFGHHAGDLVLRELARRIAESVRKTDTVARYGGDEFIVLLPDLQTPADAESIAAKIVSAVSAPVDLGNVQVSVTVSTGVCIYPQAGMDIEELLKSVDAAMYRAKASGRNGFKVYQPPVR